MEQVKEIANVTEDMISSNSDEIKEAIEMLSDNEGGEEGDE